MEIKKTLSIGTMAIAAAALWSGIALGQDQPARCNAQDKAKASTPEKVDGLVVRIDHAVGKVTIREADGKLYEFHATKDTLQDLKVGDRLEAKLRTPATC